MPGETDRGQWAEPGRRPTFSRSTGPRRDATSDNFTAGPSRSAAPPAGSESGVEVASAQHLTSGTPQRPVTPWLPAQTPQLAKPEPSAEAALVYQQPLGPSAYLAHRSIPRRWMALCFGLTFLVYVALVPHVLNYSSPPTGDQPFYLMQTLSLVQDGDLNLANNFANHDEDKFYSLAPHPPGFVGMGAPYPLPPTHIVTWSIRPPSEAYPFHLPGLPVLMVPAWIVGSWFSLWWPATIVFMCLIGALVALNIFLLAHDLTGRIWIAVAVWLVMSFSNPLMTYSYLIFTELTTALLAIYAFRRLSYGWAANRPWRLLFIGLCIAYIPWFSWRCVFISLPLILYALFQWFRYRRSTRPTPQPGSSEATSAHGTEYQVLTDPALGTRYLVLGTKYSRRGTPLDSAGMLGLLLLPIAVSALLTFWYNLFLYGQLLAPNRVPEMSEGSPFLWPWQGSVEMTHFITTGFALMFDRLAGLLTFTPVYLLSAVGMIAMFRSPHRANRRLLVWIAIVCLPYVALLMSYYFWSGLWCPPARFLTALVPFLSIPLAKSLEVGRSLYRVLFGALAVPGLAIMAIFMYDPRIFWPGNALFGWLARDPAISGVQPTWDFRLDLWNALPDFSSPNPDTQPMTTAWITAAAIVVLLIGCALMSTKGRVALKRKRSLATQGVAWLGAIAMVGGGWYDMNYEYVKPHTMLSQVASWSLSPAPQSPSDIAYLDGKVYVTAYDSPYLAELDTAVIDYPKYVMIKPTTGSKEELTYTHPGNVKVGPDKRLYVLNNGSGPQAMYAMKPDGTVVQQIPLNRTAEIAIGLQFGSDGSIYVSDMRSGRIRKYPPGGGEPISEWGGKDGGFNNVGGIVVDKDGTIYAAEISNKRIQQLASDGSFVRAFDLPCNPQYIAQDGDWLDTSCGNGLVSINKKTGALQLSRIQKGKQMQSPTGLVYAPDGTLYLVDGNMLYAYKVQH